MKARGTFGFANAHSTSGSLKQIGKTVGVVELCRGQGQKSSEPLQRKGADMTQTKIENPIGEGHISLCDFASSTVIRCSMQILFNGIILGLTIGLLALAFNVVYLPTRVFHLALGGVFAVVPFVAWQFLLWKQSWPVAILIAAGAGVLISLACESFNHARLERNGGSSGAHFISSLGIYIVTVQAIALMWGNENKVLRVGVDSVFKTGQITLTHAQLLAGVVSLLALAVFYASLKFTNIGLRLRALADNPAQLALQGYNTRLLRLFAFGIAGLLASVCSLLVAYDIGFDPHSGLIALLLAIVAVIIGGRATWLGPVLGGIVLGLIRSEVTWFDITNV